MKPPTNYQTVVENVREVSLVGHANAAPWREGLAREGLYPYLHEGRVELRLMAATMRYMGVHFGELSISVVVCDEPTGTSQDGAFLVKAFNSVRLFAWIERTLFSTPYHWADVQVKSQGSVQVSVADESGLLFQAEKSSAPTAPPQNDLDWEGVVYLPHLNGKQAGGKQFFAKLSGPTQRYPFSPTDTLNFPTHPSDEVIRRLVESNFQGSTWLVRNGATHFKSKSYNRA